MLIKIAGAIRLLNIISIILNICISITKFIIKALLWRNARQMQRYIVDQQIHSFHFAGFYREGKWRNQRKILPAIFIRATLCFSILCVRNSLAKIIVHMGKVVVGNFTKNWTIICIFDNHFLSANRSLNNNGISRENCHTFNENRIFLDVASRKIWRFPLLNVRKIFWQ